MYQANDLVTITVIVRINPRAVLGEPPSEIVRHPDVELAGLAGEDVDVVVAHR
jgi:hypothetical protein